jgi:hypothetical protein
MQRLFGPLRDDDPLPPSTVDIWRAVRDGRRRIRARWAGVGTVVLVVLAIVVPVLSHTAAGREPVGPAVQQQSDIGFDPLRRVITVGDVPGTAPQSYGTAKHWQQLTLTVNKSGFAQVIVYAPGWKATYATGGFVRPDTGTPAEPVAGRTAYWLNRTLDGQQGPMLAWEWADDAWAFVQLHGPGADQPDKDMTHRVATAVRVGDGEQVTMPFTVPVPEGHHLTGTSTQIRPSGDPFVRTGLLFDTEDPHDPDRYASDQRGFRVSVENGWKVGQQFGANGKLDDHPARVVDGQVHIFGLAGGFAVDVEGAGSQETLSAVARSVHLVSAPDDRSTWVSQPLR